MTESSKNQDIYGFLASEEQPAAVSESMFPSVERQEVDDTEYKFLSKKDKKKLKKLREREKIAEINRVMGSELDHSRAIEATVDDRAAAIEPYTKPTSQEKPFIQTYAVPQKPDITEREDFQGEPMPKEKHEVQKEGVIEASPVVNDEGGKTLSEGPETPTAQLRLPYRAQHKLMIYLQQHLEHMCFEFGQQHMAELLASRGWDCPEAVELQVWLQESSLQEYVGGGAPSVEERRRLLCSVARIRDYAVNRIRIDCAELEGLLSCALKLTMIIGEANYVEVTEKLRQDIVETDRWLGAETEQLHRRFVSKLDRITAARAKLDDLEKATREELERGLLSCQGVAHSKVVQSIQEAGASDQSADLPEQSVTVSSLDWVSDLENILMLGEDN